jgi:flavin reductase (DIM6/NTAB) family NADH-FMN oxidoreductase RutF
VKRKTNLPLGRVYRLLEPGPVVLLTTARKGRANVMTMSWHTMMEFEPPLVGCIVSNRNFSFAALRETGECVINIPGAELAKTVVAVGSSSGRKLDKFAAFGLTPLPASRVAPPLVAECFANLECRVEDARLAQKYNFFILRVVKAWIEPSRQRARTLHHMGMGNFMIAGRSVKLPSRMK